MYKTLHFNKLYFTLLYSIQFSQEVYADGNDFRHISLIFVNIYIAQFVSKEICFTAQQKLNTNYITQWQLIRDEFSLTQIARNTCSEAWSMCVKISDITVK